MLLSHLVGFLSCLSIGIFLPKAEARLTGEEIIGGDLAEEGQFPYQAIIYISDDLENKCGGAILDEQHVITAAHCVIDNTGFFGTTIKVKVGIADGTKCTDDNMVERIYIPWQYTPRNAKGIFNVTHDIAVLKVSKSFDLSSTSGLKSVKLPEKEKFLDNNKVVSRYPTYTNKKAVISGHGWNTIKFEKKDNQPRPVEDGSTDHQLRYAESTVLSPAECENLVKKDSRTLCAKMTQREDSSIRGVCSSDSGGPLVFNGTLIGVLAASPKGCTEKSRPAQYTRVSKFIPFIENAMNEKDLSTMRVAELTVQYQMVDASENSEIRKQYWNPPY